MSQVLYDTLCFLFFLFAHFSVICASYKIINAGIVIIRQSDKHFDGNIAGTGFVMRIGALADMQYFTDLFLGQIGVCPQILNTLKFHQVHLFLQ